MKSWSKFGVIFICSACLWPTAAPAQRLMENLNRGVVAMPQPDGSVFVSWRFLGTESNDLGFNVYRAVGKTAPVKVTPQPLLGPTFFVDKGVSLSQPVTYSVRAVERGVELPARGAFTIAANAKAEPYLTVPLKTPQGYLPNDASVGDLDGDGQYEIVLHQTGRGKDNSQNGETDPPILQAYRLDGTLMWEIDLGKNIREGAHYTQFMVYDLDGDGKAEVACKTGDGSRDSKGKVIGDANANWVDQSGRILKGPEYLTIFNGETGAELATTKYIPGRHPDTDDPTGDQLKEVWGDGYGNRNDRFLACIAYLDGRLPSLVMCRGYYTRTVLAAWNWRDGKLSNVWTFDSDEKPENKKFAGQGNHNLSVADVDGDGKDEIIYGGMALDDDGTGLYSTELGHGDAMHVSDLDPTRPGLEVFRIQERFGDAGAHMFDARTGQILWKKPSVKSGKDGEGPGRGLSLDIDPRYPGSESWVFGAGVKGLFDSKGKVISQIVPPTCNFGVWWDGDLLRELLDRNAIMKWDWRNSKVDRMVVAEGCESNNGTKATPTLSADLFGDWREEVIWRTKDGQALHIYTTNIPTKYRIYTLMHDPQYRLSIAWQNVAYNQPPHTGFQLGEGMPAPPRPPIVTSKAELPVDAAARRSSVIVLVKAPAGPQIVRAKSLALQGAVVVAELGEGKRALWPRNNVLAELPGFTAEELSAGGGGAPARLLAAYEAVAAAQPALKGNLEPELGLLRAKQATVAAAAPPASAPADIRPGFHP